jgi:predicted nucleic acid-binding protein
MPYVDTSALVACYIPEEKSGKVTRALSEAEENTISSLVVLEFLSAVARRARMRELSPDDGRRVISLFRLHVREGVYGFAPITQREYDMAGDWLAGLKTAIRTLDALHLAVTYASDLTLLTADTALAKAARTLGVPVQVV